MTVTPLGMVTLFKLQQSLKALNRISVTVGAIMRFFKLVQVENAHSPIAVTPLSISTDVIFVS